MHLTRDEFIARYGAIYEHSPWVADQAYDAARDKLDVNELAVILAQIVNDAPRERKLALIRLHPDLAGKAAMNGELSADSNNEQASAGIDCCTPAEFDRFQELNARYKAKFGFPFVMAVRHRHRREILGAFAERIENNTGAEFERAMREIHEIARLRLEALKEQ